MVEVHILSGGVDSTSVLHRRLAETENIVHVLHLRGTSDGAIAHTLAARQIVVWLAKNVRTFTYREVMGIQMVGKACGNILFAQCGFMLGEYIVRNPDIAAVVQGSNGDAADQSEDSLFRNRYREGVCAAVCNGYAPAPEWLYPNSDLTKLEAFRRLPPELRELCWTCFTPSRQGEAYVPCGTCEKCKELLAVKEAE